MPTTKTSTAKTSSKGSKKPAPKVTKKTVPKGTTPKATDAVPRVPLPKGAPAPKRGAVKHRKVLRDNIQGITKNALARILYRGGVKRISGLVYEELRQRLKSRTEDIVKIALTFAEHDRRKTVMEKDIYSASEQMGESLAVGINKKAKTSATSSFQRGAGATHTSGGETASQRGAGDKKPHKYRPGTVALRSIRKYQRSTGLLIPKINFERVVRELSQDYHEDMRFQKTAILLLQVWVEDYMVHLCEGANLLALHASRQTVQQGDVQLVIRLRNNSRFC